MRINIYVVLLFLFSILDLSAQSSFSLELNTKTEPTEKTTRNETEIGLSFFKNIGSKTQIINTLKYKKTEINYELEKYNLQENLNTFSSFENNFGIIYAINNSTNLSIEITPTINFDKNAGISDVNILGGLKINHFFNTSNAVTIGTQRSTLFGKTTILPTFSFLHHMNQNMAIEIGFPNSQLSYSNNDKNTFLIKNNFQGAIYNLDATETNDNYNNATKMTYSQMATTFEYERSIDSYWSLNFKGGYGFNNKYYLTNDKGDLKYDFNSNNGYIFNIGIKFKH